MKLRSAILSSILMSGACAYATEPVPVDVDSDGSVAEVSVSAIKDPELKPYRVMLAGLDAFEEHHHLAPNATLKFRLSKRSDTTSHFSQWDGLSLRLAGNETSIPLPVAADGTFILPRSKEALDDEAELILNQKKATTRFWVETRTPVIPLNARRLGDLRLECQVLIAIGKKELNFALRATFTTMLGTTDWCSAKRASVVSPLHDWAMSAVVVHGGVRKALPPTSSNFRGPIQDKSLPNDALIEFDYWGEASVERKQQFLAQYPLQLKTSMNKWGNGVPFVSTDKSLYLAVATLKPGTWKFNFESQGREVNLGTARKDGIGVLGAEQPLLWFGHRLTYKVEQAGAYTFSLNIKDPDHPVVNVTPVIAP